MAAILDAAVVVFAREGVEGATTNAIAAQAGISPGSLYQYYRDKDAVLAAVGERYAAELADVYRTAMASVDLATVPLATVLDTLLDPIVAFKDTHAAFVPLFARTDLPPSVLEPVAVVDELFAETVTSILARRNPGAAAEDVRSAARIVINLFRGTVASLGSATGDPGEDLDELKLAIGGYLEVKHLGGVAEA